MNTDTVATQSKTEAFLESLRNSYADTAPDNLKSRSADALGMLPQMQFPTTKTEYYKYTRTGRIANAAWNFARESVAVDAADLPVDLDAMERRLVFVNGRFAPELSRFEPTDGLVLAPISEAKSFRSEHFAEYTNHREDIFTALNAAMPQDGFFMKVARNQSFQEPIHVVNVFTGDGVIAQPRSHVEVEEGASVRLTEYQIHFGNGPTFANALMEVHVGGNASFGIDTIQIGTDKSFTLEQIDAIQERDSHFIQNYFTLNGNWTRNNSNCRIAGENAECNFNGFYIPSDKEHIDNHTVIDHEVPNCNSNELYRGVLLDDSTAVFNGKVFVRRDAQKTNAYQSNGNILVSDRATINSKPELEIYADDVKCSHGSTTGQLDEEALFYLQTRGLSYESSRTILIEAFAEDVVTKLVNPSLVPMVQRTIHDKLTS